ncbi:MAG: glycine cleavage system aminomethyltransferase GcvT [Saprospiraceae bacterium]|nr:glycine cleavage system aminomethyltransferase GcvT [Saprospiraceae bacterium]
MKETPLTATHIALGARMAGFAGYNMPISYAGINPEHQAVREKAGMFDVSHMGEFIVRGKEALDLIQYVTTNDASKLEIGQAQYSCLPNNDGGIIDDLLIYRLAEDNCSEGERAYMLVVNAANIEKDWEWINQHNQFDTKLINISDQTGLLAVQGPLAAKVLQPLTKTDLDALAYYTFTKGTLAGVENVLISATGYTGSGGFELYADAEKTPQLWQAIMESGKELGLQPAGLGARDTLRLEMGMCLYGNDIDDNTSPLEAGLSWITKMNKPNFLSKDIFAKQKEEGVSRRLVGFTLNERRVPRHGYTIENESGQSIGTVTSGTQSPTLGYPIGLGYVEKPFHKQGTNIFIVAGKKRLAATVSRPPFLRKD